MCKAHHYVGQRERRKRKDGGRGRDMETGNERKMERGKERGSGGGMDGWQ